MAKWVTHECYAIVFDKDVQLHFGNKIVEHRKPKANETELEVAVKLIKHYKHNGAYNHWAKINRIVEGSKQPLSAFRTDDDYHRYLNSEYARFLDILEKKVYDTSLIEMWGDKNADNQ